MKNLLILCFLFAGAQLSAQEMNDFCIGPKGGGGAFFTLGVFNAPSDYQATLSYSTGIAIEKFFMKNKSIEANLLLDICQHQKSSYSSFLNQETIGSFEYNSILVPIRFQSYFGREGSFSIGLGTFYSYIVNVAYRDYSQVTLNDQLLTNNFNRANFGLSISMGYDYEVIKNILIKFSLENYTGLRNIDNYSTSKKSLVNQEFKDVKTNNIQLSITFCYLFRRYQSCL